MKLFSMAVAGLMAIAALTPNAQAQCVASPLEALAGTWAFSTNGVAFRNVLQQTAVATAGTFTASINGSRGLLALTVTSSEATLLRGTTVTRLERDAGGYQVDPDCSGGSLFFNLSSRPVQFDFYFVNANEITIVASNYSSDGADVVVGSARRVVPQACPAQALEALAGTWVFSTTGYANFGQLNNPRTLSAAGRFAAAVGVDRAGNPLGVLALSVTSANNSTVTRRESDVGRYQVNPDCSGGTLTFNLSSRPVQFDFFFSSANRLVMIGSNQGDLVIGSAQRFGTN
jgi:hypothetical protein